MSSSRRQHFDRRLAIERLESRCLLDAGATLATAGLVDLTLGVDRIIDEAIEYPGDVDLYSLRLEAGQSLSANIDAETLGSTLDSVLRVFDGTGKEIASNDDFDANDPYIELQVQTTGTYYVGVSSYSNFFYDPSIEGIWSGSSSGQYKLRIASNSDGNDTLDRATTVGMTIGETVTRSERIDFSGDVDLYSVALAAGQRLFIEVDPQGLGGGGEVRVFDSKGEEIASNDVPYTMQAFVAAPITGNYFVGISGFGNHSYDPKAIGRRASTATGSYEFRMLLPQGTDDRIAGANHLNVEGDETLISDAIDFPSTLR